MESIDYYKQLDSSFLEEINVKTLVRPILKTEEGDIALVFDNDEQRYYWQLGPNEIKTPTPILDSQLLKVLGHHYG